MVIPRNKDILKWRREIASFDVKTLFSDAVLDGAMEAIVEVASGIPPGRLSILNADFVKIVKFSLEYESLSSMILNIHSTQVWR